MPKHRPGAKVTWDSVGAGAPSANHKPGGACVPPAAPVSSLERGGQEPPAPRSARGLASLRVLLPAELEKNK